METCSGGGNELADKQLFSRIPELEPVGGSVWFSWGVPRIFLMEEGRISRDGVLGI